MIKAAIVTLYGEYNLGNKLQNYAVEYLLTEAGCEPTTIVTSMHQPAFLKIKYLVLDVLSCISVGSDRRLIERRMMRKRRDTIKQFSDSYLHYSDRIDYRRNKDLEKLNDDYNLFISGSDQVWGSFIDEDDRAFDYYFLFFADKKKRGTLAPSLGRNDIPVQKREKYCEAFKEMRWLSCREKGIKDIISDLSEREVELLLDPTMAVPIDVWKKLEQKPVFHVPDHYILDYRLGTDKNYTDILVDKISSELKAEVVNIYNTKKINNIFEKTGPREFLWLIDHADSVITDSFHGCVFSIMFKKNFICIDRSEKSLSVNMSDRLHTLLSRFGLESQIYNGNLKNNFLGVDYSSTDVIIAEEMTRTKSFICKMIEEYGYEETERVEI